MHPYPRRLNQNVCFFFTPFSKIGSSHPFVDAKKKAEALFKIRNARQRVRSEIDDLTERLRVTQENIQRFRKRSIENNYLSGTLTSSTQDLEE